MQLKLAIWKHVSDLKAKSQEHSLNIQIFLLFVFLNLFLFCYKRLTKITMNILIASLDYSYANRVHCLPADPKVSNQCYEHSNQ